MMLLFDIKQEMYSPVINTFLATYCSILCMGCMHHTIRMYQYCVAGKKKCLFFYLFLCRRYVRSIIMKNIV